MGESTAIAWTDHTFNPWWGCTRVSPGCEHCYAEAFAHGHLNYAGEFELRQQAMGIDWMPNDRLSQALPPAYTEFIGAQLLAACGMGTP